MEQIEKVQKGLECCVLCDPDDHRRCGECPYNPHAISNAPCANGLMFNALALIRQQQERIKELEAGQTTRVLTLEEVCGWTKGEPLFIEEETPGGNFIGCNVFHSSDNQYVCFTPYQGDGSYFLSEDYGLTWRCWTQRPTDEQRKAVKWDERDGRRCEEICKHAPPEKKWPCIDCDMSIHDRAEPPKEEEHATD